MRKFHAFFLSIALLFAAHVFAQKQVKGVITDSVGNPLSNVSVQVRNASAGTRTDDKGSFSLQVPSNNSVLVISSVGYETQQVTVGSSDNFSIKLLPAQQALAEIV